MAGINGQQRKVPQLLVIVQEEKELIRLDWPAYRPAKLMAHLVRLDGLIGGGVYCQRIDGIEILVTIVPKGISMKLVGARANYRVDAATRGASKFGKEVALSDLKLLHGIFADIGGNSGASAAFGKIGLIIVVAFHHEVVERW